MKTYTANAALIETLKKNNFVETSSLDDILKKERRFKLYISSLKELQIDKQNIVVYEAGVVQDSRTKVTEQELRLLILYFKLKTKYLSEFSQDLPFTFDKIVERFANMEDELELLVALNVKINTIKRIDRVIDAYNDIEL